MKPLNILVFPCGSEIALEVHRSLKFSRHIKLFGANSVSDHGKFVFENYAEGLPFVTAPDFISKCAALVKDLKIDAIYPAMDAVITKLKENEEELGCKVISSSIETTKICLSKAVTYERLKNVVPIPEIYPDIESIKDFPVFMKPAIGYGSRGASKIENTRQAQQHAVDFPGCIIMELLTGEEYTVDCFTNNKGVLLFAGARPRRRVTNGISVNTISIDDNEEVFQSLAKKINVAVEFNGAWFFQVKEDASGNFKLLEVASRLGGSSALYRNKGINFALLSVFNDFDFGVEIIENNYSIELDRALSNKYKIDFEYEEVYVDFDDCLIINEKVNESLVAFIYQCFNLGKKVKLITRHEHDIQASLKKYRLSNLFDEVIHITKEDAKHKYITNSKAIFIDDSHQERKLVAENKKIPVFSPDMIESLIWF
jgi:hypothetical protein